MPSALELSRYLAVAPPRRASTLDPSDGSSIFGRACAHCHDGQLATDLRRQTLMRRKLVDVIEARGQLHGCLFRPKSRDFFTAES